ncbi:MAG: hypothetical protein MUP55_01005 [Candidatus Aenigmarchaeota archaeon]|nr:hypothetical protein [Candidatus Aenigmarchaeota archaeon]
MLNVTYDLALLLLASIGLTFIITQSYILMKFRDSITNSTLRTFISCPQCVGFWVGLILTFSIEWWNDNWSLSFGLLVLSGLMGLANSGICHIVELATMPDLMKRDEKP